MKYLNLKRISFLAVLSAAQLFANESFGGIGVSIYQTRNGVKVAEIIPGTPAAEGKLQVGDEIIAVDGESLKGKTIEESKASLRGQKNKPLELTFVSGGDTLQTVLRRTQITLRDLESDGIEAWYGGKLEFDAQEVETYASATENEKQLVAVRVPLHHAPYAPLFKIVFHGAHGAVHLRDVRRCARYRNQFFHELDVRRDRARGHAN